MFPLGGRYRQVCKYIDILRLFEINFTVIYYVFVWQGALLLTEVLKERDAQLDLKMAREAAMEGNDRELFLRAQRELEEGILADQEKALKRMQDRKANSEFQTQQWVFFLEFFMLPLFLFCFVLEKCYIKSDFTWAIKQKQ